MFTPGPPVSVGGVQCKVAGLPLIGSHDVDGTFISVGYPGTAVNYIGGPGYIILDYNEVIMF